MLQKRWSCLGCGADSVDTLRPEVCARCGQVESYVNTLPPRTTRLIQASRIPLPDVARIPTKEVELDALLDGGFARGAHALIYGMPGAGKSRLTMRWLTAAEPALWVTHEMSEELVALTATSVGAVSENLWVADHARVDELESLIDECGARIVVVDSISELEANEQESLIAWARDWSPPNLGFVAVVCQVTKEGEFLGPAHLAHDLDYRLKFSRAPNQAAFIDVEKSRYSPVGRASAFLCG